MSAINGVSKQLTNQAASTAQSSLLTTLKKQYPALKLSAQAFSGEASIRQYAQGKSGSYNVAIDPRALKRMEADPEFSDKIHGILGGIKEMDDLNDSMTKAMGARTIARGTIIDQDGNVSYWGVVQTGDGKETHVNKKSQKELMEELMEKRRLRQEELKETREEITVDEKVDSLEVTASVKVSENTTSSGVPEVNVTA